VGEIRDVDATFRYRDGRVPYELTMHIPLLQMEIFSAQTEEDFECYKPFYTFGHSHVTFTVPGTGVITITRTCHERDLTLRYNNANEDEIPGWECKWDCGVSLWVSAAPKYNEDFARLHNMAHEKAGTNTRESA